eukprot:178394_1
MSHKFQVVWLLAIIIGQFTNVILSLPAEAEFRALNDLIDGDVFLPSDNNFDNKNEMWWIPFNNIPSSAIIYANNEKDIVVIIKFLNDYVNVDGTQFRICASGSSFGGYSKCHECIIIDTRRLQDIKYIPSKSPNKIYASVATATTMQQLMDSFQTNAYGNIKIPHTTCGNVTVGGYYASGGFHNEFAKYGYASDYIVGVRMVLNDGSIILIYDNNLCINKQTLLNDEILRPDIIKVQKRNKKDLLWAIKGSGAGSFGVVTRYYIQTTPLPQQNEILAFSLNFKYERNTAIDIIKAGQNFRNIANNDFNVEINLLTVSDFSQIPIFPNGFRIQVNGNYIGNDIKYAKNLITETIIHFNKNTYNSYVTEASNIITNINYFQLVNQFGDSSGRFAAYNENRLMFRETDLDAFFEAAIEWHWNTVINNTMNTICGPNTLLKCLFGSLYLFDFWNDILLKTDKYSKNTAAPNRNSIGMFSISTGVLDTNLWNDNFDILSRQTLLNGVNTVFNSLGTQTYIGYRNIEQSDISNYYGERIGNNGKLLKTLKKIKKRYDRDNFFRVDNVSIPIKKMKFYQAHNFERDYVQVLDTKDNEEQYHFDYRTWTVILVVGMVVFNVSALCYCLFQKMRQKPKIYVSE